MPKKDSDNLTTADIYNLVDRKTEEVKGHVLRLETKFDNLESGRLSVLEEKYATLIAKVAQSDGRATMIPTLVSVAIAVFGIIINFVIFTNK